MQYVDSHTHTLTHEFTHIWIWLNSSHSTSFYHILSVSIYLLFRFAPTSEPELTSAEFSRQRCRARLDGVGSGAAGCQLQILREIHREIHDWALSGRLRIHCYHMLPLSVDSWTPIWVEYGGRNMNEQMNNIPLVGKKWSEAARVSRTALHQAVVHRSLGVPDSWSDALVLGSENSCDFQSCCCYWDKATFFVSLLVHCLSIPYLLYVRI